MPVEREDLRLRLQRKTRFTMEAVRPPPPLPASRIAWAGGPIVTSDKTECLRKLIERKIARKQPIPPELQDAARQAGLEQLLPSEGSTFRPSAIAAQASAPICTTEMDALEAIENGTSGTLQQRPVRAATALAEKDVNVEPDAVRAGLEIGSGAGTPHASIDAKKAALRANPATTPAAAAMTSENRRPLPQEHGAGSLVSSAQHVIASAGCTPSSHLIAMPNDHQQHAGALHATACTAPPPPPPPPPSLLDSPLCLASPASQSTKAASVAPAAHATPSSGGPPPLLTPAMRNALRETPPPSAPSASGGALFSPGRRRERLLGSNRVPLAAIAHLEAVSPATPSGLDLSPGGVDFIRRLDDRPLVNDDSTNADRNASLDADRNASLDADVNAIAAATAAAAATASSVESAVRTPALRVRRAQRWLVRLTLIVLSVAVVPLLANLASTSHPAPRALQRATPPAPPPLRAVHAVATTVAKHGLAIAHHQPLSLANELAAFVEVPKVAVRQVPQPAHLKNKSNASRAEGAEPDVLRCRWSWKKLRCAPAATCRLRMALPVSRICSPKA